jgi:hypothetical protein
VSQRRRCKHWPTRLAGSASKPHLATNEACGDLRGNAQFPNFSIKLEWFINFGVAVLMGSDHRRSMIDFKNRGQIPQSWRKSVLAVSINPNNSVVRSVRIAKVFGC